MSHGFSSPIPAAAPVAIPVRALLPWAVFGLLLSALLLYFVGAEQGARSEARVVGQECRSRGSPYP